MKYFCLLFLAALTLNLDAQKIIIPDSTIPKEKTHYKYLGIQANLLLQQFISFNSNSSINSNPYIFSYSKNKIKTGSGFAFGTGFNISENSSNDGVSASNVKNVNFSFRIGYEKKYLQQERFIPFWGVEFGAGALSNIVTSSLAQSFNTNKVRTETDKFFAGPAFRAGLLVAFTKHILIGTEFYFNAQVAITETNSSGFGSDQAIAPLNIGFQAPTALFLAFRY
jgi:hypothetical protein